MNTCCLFLYLMHSLDTAFCSQQGLCPRHPDSWGERFFQELSLNHPQWVDQKVPIYMKACEMLHYYAFFERADELFPIIYKKPEALLQTVLMLFRYGKNDCSSADIGEQNAADEKPS